MTQRLIAVVREARPDLEIPDDIGAALAALITAALAEHPDIPIAPERFTRFLAGKLEPPFASSLDKLHAGDLLIACGCVDGLPAAIAAFDRACGSTINSALAKSGATLAEVDDLRQIVRKRLLVDPAAAHAHPAAPRIATFGGRSSLTSWAYVVAVNEAARLLPRERREIAADNQEIVGRAAEEDDPELAYMKGHYRDAFKHAVNAAFDALNDRERLLLQQHELNGITIDQLAAFYKVHRSTTARWVEAARNSVLVGTRAELTRSLDVSRDTLDSIMRLLGSQLDVSLPALLKR
jgi:RNA polymerase sigma-70 factor (ECF subfamily)